MKKTVILTLLLTLIIVWNHQSIFSQENSKMKHPQFTGKISAPEFPKGLEWLNTEKPLTLTELRGKVVLLDFWTYCCINCMHVIPDLKKLEKKYEKELVVIGVHSAKFTIEKETQNIRQAVLRYEIEHPVVNDSDMRIWQEYNIRAWPTLVLIDPTGKIVGARAGEGVYAPFDDAISKVIENYDASGLINRKPLKLKPEKREGKSSIFSFPGKVLADEKSNRLIVADSNNNRIVIISLSDNSVLDIIGSGQIGLKDGRFEKAMLNHPQGMTLEGDTLYIADTENHAIRKADLKKRKITTIAGNGSQANPFAQTGGPGETALNSPWDVVHTNGNLYIAMAGSHQLWRLNTRTGRLEIHSGSGMEARIDGPHSRAALAQPSGITTDGSKLYFADSEVSSIRSADISPNGKVNTIVGLDLFEFGDRDGKGKSAKLQHPLGVVYHEGHLYVADTYNNKIKVLSLEDGEIRTLIGDGASGLKDGKGEKARLNEPAGLSIANGMIYIADTNNHRIRAADIKTKTVTTLNPQTKN